MAAEMTQMNARIERQVKDEGDAVFSKLGYLPSQVVRAVWSWAARHRHEPEAVRAFLNDAETGGTSDETARRRERVAAYATFQAEIAAFREQMGAGSGAESSWAHLSYKELRDRMYDEKLAEYDAESPKGQL